MRMQPRASSDNPNKRRKLAEGVVIKVNKHVCFKVDGPDTGAQASVTTLLGAATAPRAVQAANAPVSPELETATAPVDTLERAKSLFVTPAELDENLNAMDDSDSSFDKYTWPTGAPAAASEPDIDAPNHID